VSLIKVKGSSITGALAAVDGSALTGIAGGLTEVDNWRLTTSFNGDGDWTNMERVDTDAAGHVGTGLSNSGAVFSFPSTGYYLLQVQANFYKSASSQRLVGTEIYFTTNNSSYTSIGWSRATMADETGDSSNNYISVSQDKLFDITDISNQKFKIYSLTNSDSAVYTKGDTNELISGFTIMKLANT
tara:strand:- start:372 stop:929 length:558 start_codon:yes stop_codon:yes gene_type:complete